MRRPQYRTRIIGCVAAVFYIAVPTAAMRLLVDHVNSATVALALLLAVLFVATRWGSGPAIFASVLGVFCINFFFLPPVHTLTIADPQNWVALTAFLITAVTAGELSARARRRAEEAETRRQEVDRLYKELRDAFERASHAEAMRQSELLKSALLDAVTHDLRTPLTSIKASVTTLLDESTDAGSRRELAVEARRDMLEVINEEADRLNGSIEKLLELARIEAGELNLRRRWGAVEEIVVNAIDRAKQLTARHKVQSSIDAGVPVVFVDAQAISEVLYTLIDNAAKYSPGGTTITLTAAPAGEGTVRLSVEDEGPGIPEGMRERVFDKFFRLTQPPTSRSQARGTGMGLAIARGIVEAHGGRIRIEGNPGTTGARVVLDLPVGDEEPTNAHAGAGLEPISAGSFAAVKKTDNQNR